MLAPGSHAYFLLPRCSHVVSAVTSQLPVSERDAIILTSLRINWSPLPGDSLSTIVVRATKAPPPPYSVFPNHGLRYNEGRAPTRESAASLPHDVMVVRITNLTDSNGQ